MISGKWKAGDVKIGNKSCKVKKYFGSYLADCRKSVGLSNYDIAYILDVCHLTPWNWEHGVSFPQSIILLKKLGMIYGELPYWLKDIIRMGAIKPSRLEWKRFEEIAYSGDGNGLPSCGTQNYRSIDMRDNIYKKAFGKYLMNERCERGIGVGSIAEALGVGYHRYLQWEYGSNFPQEVMTLIYLDKFYGNTFDVLFGLCKKNGIHLDRIEKLSVLRKLEEFENTGIGDSGKPQPSDWQRYANQYYGKRRKVY